MLSELQIMNKWASVLTEYKSTGERIFEFARAIEAEVRKDDEALIRQMLESMCWAAWVMTISEDEAPRYFAAITAAKERLRDYRLPE